MGSVKLAYEEYGDHSSEPLLLLHGFFASSRNWRLIAKKLAEFYHVYVLDLRNHGLSPHVPTMDYPAMADDLAGFMVGTLCLFRSRGVFTHASKQSLITMVWGA